jgi:hypothetical protein
MVYKVLGVAAIVMIGLASGAPSQAADRRLAFFGSGYVCIRSDRTLLVDSPVTPDCQSSIGVSLPPINRKRLPNTPQRQPTGWSVTPQPMTVNGFITNGNVSLSGIAAALPRSQRTARSLATIEVGQFDVIPNRPITNPNTIFDRLPLLATAAPNATVRLARSVIGNTYQYGAQIRDPLLTAAQRASLELVAAEQRIALVINTTPAAILPASCVGLPNSTDQLTGFGVDVSSRSTRWAKQPQQWIPAATTCDELSQVQVVQAPIVGSLGNLLRSDTDTVVDATVRINQSS